MEPVRMYKPDKEENTRLKLQNKLLDLFDFEIYKSVLGKYASFDFLDVGCGSGAMIIPKLRNFSLGRFVGIDRSDLQINRAREKFPDANLHFECADVEDENFEQELRKLLSDCGIEKSDVINLSMVLLHLKDPTRVLGILHSYLKDDGYIIIRDIDDGLNFVSDDENGLFKRIYKIAREDDITGNRYMGRAVYPSLVKAGYRDVELKREGLSTIGLNAELKEAFYEMSFKAMMDRTEVMLKKHPEEKNCQENYAWVKEHEKEVHDKFIQEDFVASLGFMSYVARK